MKWDGEGNVSVTHPRQPWDRSLDILVNADLDLLYRGGAFVRRRTGRAIYSAAKFEFDHEAAMSVVKRCVRDEVIDSLVDKVLLEARMPQIVFPHPAFDDDDGVGHQDPIGPRATNAIPFIYANFLAEILGCPISKSIVQCARVGRTKLTAWLRFLCQPSFVGEVLAGQPYIIVDDVVTTGGTFAALRSYIASRGGTVVAASALAHKSGRDQCLTIAKPTLDVLHSLYGARFGAVWAEVIGHDPSCLTEGEGQTLARWACRICHEEGCSVGDELLHRLRNRLNKAAARGR